MKMSPSELATHVVSRMSYNELIESAITGMIVFYGENRQKYLNDLVNEGFEEKVI